MFYCKRIPFGDRQYFIALVVCAYLTGIPMFEHSLSAQADTTPKESYIIGEGEVDLKSGMFLFSNQDAEIGQDEHGGLKLVRHHANAVSEFGPEFGHNYTYTIYRSTFREADHGSNQTSRRYKVLLGGQRENFVQYYSEEYANIWSENFNPIGKLEINGPVTQFDGPFTYSHPDGTIVQFGTIAQTCHGYDANLGSRCAEAVSLSKRDGSRIEFNYDLNAEGAKRLRSVSNNRGLLIGFEYAGNSSGGPISRVCTVNLAQTYVDKLNPCLGQSPSATYTYDSVTKALTAYTDATGATTTYGYAGYSLVGSITLPGQSQPFVTIQYLDPSNKVARQDYADGTSRLYSWARNDPPWSEAFNWWTEVTGPGTGTRRYEFGGPGIEPILVRDNLGRTWTRTLGLAMNSYTVVTSATQPDGNQVVFGYAQRQLPTETRVKAKPGSGEQDIVTTATYPPSIMDAYGLPTRFCTIPGACDKPLTQTDANGNTTTYTYSTTHGMVLTETKPAVGGIAPVTRFVYGQRYAWLKNAGSGYSQAPEPIWLLLEERTCRTTATVGSSCAGGAADEIITTYEYQNGSSSKGSNLWLVGTAVTGTSTSGLVGTLRTCFAYDAKGRRISTTEPKAGRTSCQ